MEGKLGRLEQSDSVTPTIGTQTEGVGGVFHLALDLVLKNSVVDGKVVGAEVRYAPEGTRLVLQGAFGRRTSRCHLPGPVVPPQLPYCPLRPARWAMTVPSR